MAHKTTTCTYDIISNVPRVNAFNRRDVFAFIYFISYSVNFILCMLKLRTSTNMYNTVTYFTM